MINGVGHYLSFKAYAHMSAGLYCSVKGGIVRPYHISRIKLNAGQIGKYFHASAAYGVGQPPRTSELTVKIFYKIVGIVAVAVAKKPEIRAYIASDRFLRAEIGGSAGYIGKSTVGNKLFTCIAYSVAIKPEQHIKSAAAAYSAQVEIGVICKAYGRRLVGCRFIAYNKL